MNTARDAILAAVRANAPKRVYPLPELSPFPFNDGGDMVARFCMNLEAMGGGCYQGDIDSAIQELFPDAGVIVSAVPEYRGSRAISVEALPRSFSDVDVFITRAAFGVAETGSVLLVDQALICNAAAYLSQHLVVLLRSSEILPSLQEAYRRTEVHNHRYSSFHSGPSATADIEGVLIHGAQGVRSLTVLLC